MEKNELIEELLSELSYRSNEGYPMLDNREQISILAEILDEWGYTEIKNELIQNLLEADGETFTATSKKSGETAVFKSKDNRDAAIEKGTHSKKEDSEEDDSKEKPKSAVTPGTPSGDSYNDSLSDDDPAKIKKPKKEEPKSEPVKLSSDFDNLYYADDFEEDVEKLKGKISDENYKKIQQDLENLKYAQQDAEAVEGMDADEMEDEGFDSDQIKSQEELDDMADEVREFIQQFGKSEPKKEKPKTEPKKDEPKRVPIDSNDSYYIKTAVERKLGPEAFKALSYGDMQKAYNDEMVDQGWESDKEGNWTKPVKESVNEADGETFTATKKDTNQTVAFDSEEARDAAIEKGTHSKKEDSEEDDSKEKKNNMFSKDSGYDAPDIKKPKKKSKGNGYTGSKNKTLRNVNPIESKNYQMDLEPNDDVFEEKNKNNANPTPPEPLKLDNFIKNPKFPKRYVKVLERMINSRITTETAKWTHFSDIEGGAGKISAQAGELMTMMGSTMSDDEWNEFTEAILKHEQELLDNHPDVFKKKNAKGKLVDNPGSRIIDKSWVKAATQSRKAIIDRLEKQYGEGTTIVASSWDAKGEAEAMGIENYKENKGFSTDMYLRVRKPNGEEVLDEISLKKSKNVNFLNSGAGQFKDWLGDDLPDEINQSVYKENQRESIAATGQSIKSDIESLLKNNPEKAKELQKVFKAKGLDFNQALDNLQNKKGDYRKSSSVVMACIKSLADWPSWGKRNDKGPNEGGNIVAQQYLREASEKQTKFIEASIKSISENPKMKEGMMASIREEFPLKAVSEGEETMAIGDMSLDKDTMIEIFGTSNYDDIKEKLVSQPGPPPFLGYQAEVGDDVIPIAEVSVREDGVGYGGQIKFEMKLHPKFASTLKEATSKVYSK